MFLDQVHFEVIDYSAAVRLTERLGQTWTAGLLGGEPYVVAAAVSSEPSDLATLLRNVQAWIREESLYAIRFMLDNEIYVIQTALRQWFADQGFIEVETPILQVAPGAEVHLAGFGTEWKTPSFLIPVEEIEDVDEVEESPRAA